MNSLATMDERFLRAIRRTFEVIASDLMACDEQTSISGSDAREITLDANYMEVNAGDREVVIEFRKLSYEEQNKIAKRALPERRYS